MKTVYFVRHGESEQNVGHQTYLGEGSKLTERGREQARFIAERCKKLAFDVLIASTAVRAQETARFISEATGKEIETNELFTERKAPQELLGRSTSDPEAKELEEEWMLSFFRDDVRVASGENFGDLKARALEALKHVRTRPEEHILVATHGFFLHMVAALVALGEELTATEFNRMAPAVWIDNTGITRLEYRDQVFARIDKRRHKGWVLRVWNDHAHLG